MNIQPITYNNISMNGKSGKPSGSWKNFKDKIKQRILDSIPETTVEDSANRMKKWKYIDEVLSRPAENRAIMGATAILSQPLIDGANHKVDEETRIVSQLRTAAKIIAGTLVGIFVVRGPIQRLIRVMTDIAGKKSYSRALLPKKYIKELSNPANEKKLKNYRSALSTGIAVMAMCGTNFLLDLPLTVYLTNKFTENNKRLKQIAAEKEALKSARGTEVANG